MAHEKARREAGLRCLARAGGLDDGLVGSLVLLSILVKPPLEALHQLEQGLVADPSNRWTPEERALFLEHGGGER